MKRFINQFFYFFGGFTFVAFCSYFVTKGDGVLFIDSMEFADDKKALTSFLWLIGGCIVFAFMVAREKKGKENNNTSDRG